MTMAGIVLAGGSVLPSPGEPSIPDGVVLVVGEEIAAVGPRSSVPVPAGACVLDCAGSTVMAGFWNSHVHFFERKWAGAVAIPADELARQLEEAFTRFGFTSVFDLSSAWENTRAIRARVESGEVAGPRILSTGEGIVPPGAVPSEAVLAMMGIAPTPLPEVHHASGAAMEARRLVEAGVDGIKIFASAPRGAALGEDVLRAAVREAHRANKPAFVHPNTTADVLAALGAGADVVAHTTPRGAWHDDVRALVAEHRAALTPTLTVLQHFLRHDRLSARKGAAEAAGDQLRDWREAGGTILFGTDLGAVGPDPRDEYGAMAAAGMAFEDVLASLTTDPAARFARGERTGRLAPGFRADVTVVAGDPTADPAALAEVRWTIRAGRVIFSGRD
jgi:imidazolonepropionase-like amidohydrolase